MVYVGIVVGYIISTLITICLCEEQSNGSFISFEEWKQSKKDEVGKDPMLDSNAGSRRIREPSDPSCYRGGDCYGEEMEIELGFLSGGNEDIEEPEGRVYKDKYNYASLDCAATIVKTNSEASGATSILVENKDKYLLNPCAAESQYVIIELCEDILVEEIKLGNYEYFSSTFKDIKFYVSDRLPVTKSGWTLIGEFQAENNRQLQNFNIENPRRWARYLRVEIVSHYGNEFYCPLSTIKVHGQTMMDEFKMAETEPQFSEEIDVKDKMKESEEVEMKNDTDTIVETLQDEDMNCENVNSNKKNSNHTVIGTIDKEEVIIQKRKDICIEEGRCREEKFKRWLEASNKIFEPKQLVNVTETCINGTVVKTNTGIVAPRKPTTEESLFKNMVKRLNTLESNSTLTVQYIEEQNRILTKSLNNSVNDILQTLRAEMQLLQLQTELQIAVIKREQNFLLGIITLLVGSFSLYIFYKRKQIII